MEAKQFKQLIDEISIEHQGKKVGKKYVWLHNDVVIFLDIQRSEFKPKAFFINVNYFLCSVTGPPDIDAFEYLGDICYRFNASIGDEDYSDVFAIDELQNEVDIRNTLEREFTYFIKNVRTSSDLEFVIKNRPNVKPFMKGIAEKHFKVPPPKKKSFFGFFRL